MQTAGTPKVLFFHNHQKKRSSLMVNLPQKNKNQIPVLQIYLVRNSVLKCFLSKLQNDLDLKTAECNDLHSRLDLQKESFEKQIKSALEKICDLEKQLH